MEPVDILTVIKYAGSGTAVVVLWMEIRNIRGELRDMRIDVKEKIREIKEGITWGDTCRANHKEIDRRLDRLERVTNGVANHD